MADDRGRGGLEDDMNSKLKIVIWSFVMFGAGVIFAAIYHRLVNHRLSFTPPAIVLTTGRVRFIDAATGQEVGSVDIGDKAESTLLVTMRRAAK